MLVVALLGAGASACSSSSSTGRSAIEAIAGTGAGGFGGDGGPAAKALLDNPSGLAFDGKGNLFVSDSGNHRVRKIDRNNRITTVAGNGSAGSKGDGGPATSAQLVTPAGLAVDSAGNLFIADSDASQVRRVDAEGRISTVAGTGVRSFDGDGGPATAAALNGPQALVAAGQALFIAGDDGRVRKVDAAGEITTVAGGGEQPLKDLAIDTTGSATAYDLGRIEGLVAAGNGDLILSAYDASKVLRLDSAGNLTVVAAAQPNDPDPRPVRSYVSGPAAMAIGRQGDVFVAEPDGSKVLRIDSRGVVFTIAEAPKVSRPVALAVDSQGRLLVADAGAQQVRRWAASATRGVEFGGARPVVQHVSPATGGAGGGTTVFIDGDGFSTLGTTVTFGGRPAQVLKLDEHQMMVSSPPGTAGKSDKVVVTTPAGASAPSPAGRFSYVAAWEVSGALAAGRYSHTATLLDPPACHSPNPPAGYPCGNVLVAGGYEPQGILSGPAPLANPLLASSELYDPATGKWTATGDLTVARRYATATLLNDGRVLVVGGLGEGDATGLDSAELYDPVSRHWTLAAEPGEPRAYHTATLLNDGRVLIAGGGTPYEPAKDSAEVFDPASGTWTAVGPMAAGREGSTATSLPDGRVLVAGGLGKVGGSSPDALGSLTSAEIFDPKTNGFSPTANMAVARSGATATLLRNGEVLVAGGLTSAEPYVQSQSAELYNPQSQGWRPAAIPNDARGSDTATLLPDGRVLVVGGGQWPGQPYTGWAASSPNAEIYDPTTNRWSRTRILNTARQLHTATPLDGPACRGSRPPAFCGGVLVVGGGGTTVDLRAGGPGLIGLASTELYR